LVQLLIPDNLSPLAQRVLAALVLAPPVLLALYLGSPYSDLLIFAAAGISAWEWARLCGGGSLQLTGMAVIASVLLAVLSAALGSYEIAAWVVVVGAMAVAVIAANHQQESVSWYVGGVLYLSWSCIAFIWLRQDETLGVIGILWLLLVVWGTDIGAYFAGRSLGGPKLAPRFSPNKTWSGLAGGGATAALVGLVAAIWMPEMPMLLLAILSAMIAVVAQIGDLFESSLKRRFDAKDSSNLIPGHGGLLDRIDGVLAASLAVAAIAWLAGV
jgi:phosphatidate cytidylyltransferase